MCCTGHKSGVLYGDAIIDKDEFKETMINLKQIKLEALAFVEDYIDHIKGIRSLHEKEFDRRYGFSPLKYFHKELGINE